MGNQVGTIFESERHRRIPDTRIHVERERIVGAVHCVEPDDSTAPERVSTCLFVTRRVAEDVERVEQCCEPSASLHVAEPEMVMPQQRTLFTEQAFEQRRDLLAWPDPDTHGNGVERQAHHAVGVLDLG